MKYYQCRMHQISDIENSKYVIIAWIEEKGAKKGALVELKGENGLWHVDTVDSNPINYEDLNEKQRKDRRSLGSITG